MIDDVFVKEMLKALEDHLEKDAKEITYRRKILEEWKEALQNEK
jgi:hypothetical protein